MIIGLPSFGTPVSGLPLFSVPSVPDSVPPPLPTITSFTASPTTLPVGGGSSTLTWTSTDGTSASIDNGVGSVAVNGSTVVSVTSTTTFVITVTNVTGSRNLPVTITVTQPTPVIDTFTATPSSFAFGGGSVTLNWATTNITSVNIDNGVGSVAVDGSTVVSVTTSTTFNLTGIGPGGTVFASATVTVNPPPPLPTITSFTATPNNFAFGGGTTNLAWTTTNASTVSINQGVGSVVVNGNTNVLVTTTKTFTITATNISGSTQATVSVLVGAPAPTIDTFTATPSSFAYGGGSSTLAWTTTNATSVSIDNGVGSVAVDGSTVVHLTTTSKTYNLTATGPGGTVFASITVTVDPPPPLPTITSFTSSSYTLPYGGSSVTLTWTSTGATSASIDNGVGTVAVNDSTVVNVTSTTTFTLLVSNISGSRQSMITVTVSPAPPTIDNFTATPNTFPFGGGSSTLAWATTNASTVSIDNGVGSVVVDGSTGVTVAVSTTYALTATGPGGTVFANVTITVNSIPPPPPAPTITSFIASSYTVPYGGDTVTLTWTSDDATSASIDNGVGSVAVDDSVDVLVTATTTFTLTVDNVSGSAEAEVTITVLDPVPTIDTFTATPSSFAYGGGTSNLAWTTTNASTVSIDNGIGSVAVDSNTNVSPTVSTTYNLTATGPGGTVFSSVTITVDPPPPAPVIDTFTASPNVFAYGGGSSTLTWTTSNADTISIDQGIGSVAADSSTVVSVTTTKSFTITATGVGGTAQATITITVLPPVPSITSFTANPSNLAYGGGSSTITWTTNNITSVSIDNGVGSVAVNGSAVVHVTTNTIFNITGTGSGGTVYDSLVISVDPPPPLPLVVTFEASSTSLPLGGGDVTLYWTTSDAVSLSIDNGIGSKPINGSVVVNITESTVFTITVTNLIGSTTRSLAINVIPPIPTIDSFTASPSSVPFGGSYVTLSWETTDVTLVTIDNEIGIVPVDGSIIVFVENNARFNLTAFGPGGVATADIIVEYAVTFTTYNFEYTILGDTSAISATLYKYLSDRYSLVLRNINEGAESLNAAIAYVAQMDNVEVKLDLLQPLRESNRAIAQIDFSKLFAAVESLNNHVLDRDLLADINDYLSENEIKVLPEWVDLCAEVGVTINPENVVES